METEDMYIRLDKDIAGFLDFLDGMPEKTITSYFSADHGVSYTPYFLTENRIPAGSLKSSDLAAAINRHLEKQRTWLTLSPVSLNTRCTLIMPCSILLK